MRTALELIAELNAEKHRFRVLALAIAFQSFTTFIFANEDGGSANLNDAMERGGVPVGFVGIVDDGDRHTLYSCPLLEHEKEEWVSEYLHAVAEAVAKRLKFSDAESLGGPIN